MVSDVPYKEFGQSLTTIRISVLTVSDKASIMASWAVGVGGEVDECSIWVTTKDQKKRMDLLASTESVPPEYVCLGIEGVIRENDRKTARLLVLLNDDQRSWYKISCYEGFVEFFFDDNQNDEEGPSRASQTYLSVLESAMRKTKHFLLDIFHRDEAVYQCLMAGLSSPNGMVEELHISHCNAQQGFHQAHARLLAEGLALATNLRKLKLSLTDFFSSAQPVDVPQRMMIGATLLDGIQRNTSILELDLEIGDIVDVDFVSQLVEALLSRPKGLQSLRMANHRFTEADLGNLRRFLGQEDCMLRQLALNNTGSLEDPTALLEDLQNKTVHTLNLSGAELSDDALVLLPFAFPNLSTLDLSHNFIDDLSFLDPLLCENSALLESLHLQHNPIWRQSMIDFASKLPRMRGLRSLSLFDNKFLESPSAVDALLDNILNNKSLENLYVTKFHHEKADLVLHCLNLNRGGRRGIDLDSASLTLDRKLWPLVFHRCMVIQDYQCIKSTGCTFRSTDAQIQADIIYWLLRHRFLLS